MAHRSMQRRNQWIITAALAASIMTLVAGCSTGNSGYAALEEAVEPLWTVDLPTLGTSNYTVGDRILSTALDGDSETKLVALDITDGSQVWSEPIGAWSIDRAAILANTEDGPLVVRVSAGEPNRVEGTWEGTTGAWTFDTSVIDLLSPKDGSLVASYPVPDHGAVAAVNAIGSYVLVAASVPTEPDPAGPTDGDWKYPSEVRNYFLDAQTGTFNTASDLGLDDEWIALSNGLVGTWLPDAKAPSIVDVTRDGRGHSVELPASVATDKDQFINSAKAMGLISGTRTMALAVADPPSDGQTDVKTYRTIVADLDNGTVTPETTPGRPCGTSASTFLLCTGTGQATETEAGGIQVHYDTQGFTGVDSGTGKTLWSIDAAPRTTRNENTSYSDVRGFLLFTQDAELSMVDIDSGDIIKPSDGTAVLCSTKSYFTGDTNVRNSEQTSFASSRFFACGADLAPLTDAGWNVGMVSAGNWWSDEFTGAINLRPESSSDPQSGTGSVHVAVSHDDKVSLFELPTY